MEVSDVIVNKIKWNNDYNPLFLVIKSVSDNSKVLYPIDSIMHLIFWELTLYYYEFFNQVIRYADFHKCIFRNATVETYTKQYRIGFVTSDNIIEADCCLQLNAFSMRLGMKQY